MKSAEIYFYMKTFLKPLDQRIISKIAKELCSLYFIQKFDIQKLDELRNSTNVFWFDGVGTE